MKVSMKLSTDTRMSSVHTYASGKAFANNSGLPVKSGLLAYYPLTRGSGTLAEDVSGNANHATLGDGYSAAPTWISGSGGLTFTLSGNALAIPKSLATQIETAIFIIKSNMPIGDNGTGATGSVVFDAAQIINLDPGTDQFQLNTGSSRALQSSTFVNGVNIYSVVYGSPMRLFCNTSEFTPYAVQMNQSTMFNSTPAGFSVGAKYGGGYPLHANIYSILFYSVQLTSSQIFSVGRWLNKSMLKRGITIGNVVTGRAIICDGDSLTGGNGGNTLGGGSYPGQVNYALTSTHNIVNLGVSGREIITMVSDAPTVIDPLYNKWISNGIPVVCIWGGTNDLFAGQSTSSTFTNYQNYCIARHNAGFKVIAFTMLPRYSSTHPTGDAALETARQSFNTSVRNDTHWDALCDVGNDANIGQNGDNANLTYYESDNLHLNTTGYGVVQGYVTTALGTLGIS